MIEKNVYDQFPKLAEHTMPKRETVRYYPVATDLRDWKELTKGMSAEQLLQLKAHVEKRILENLGS
jgi:hypothetical protein